MSESHFASVINDLENCFPTSINLPLSSLLDHSLPICPPTRVPSRLSLVPGVVITLPLWSCCRYVKVRSWPIIVMWRINTAGI